MTRLSVRKHVILEETAIAFSQAYHRVIEWGYANWDAVPFTFPANKDGESILDKEGKQKQVAMPAHSLANWLSSRVKFTDLGMSSKIGNGVYNQAAETLLSQYRLRETAEKDPKRLTGPEVGRVTRPPLTQDEVDNKYRDALATLKRLDVTDKEFEAASTIVQKLRPEPHWLPVLFARPNDFLLFRHTKTDRIYVCLPLLGRGNDRATKQIQNGKSELVPLREDSAGLPNSKQWILFPLRAAGSESRLAIRHLTDPAAKIRTGELLKIRDGWHFNVIVNVPEAESIIPETFMAVHAEAYQIYYKLSNSISGMFDLSHLRKIIEDAEKQRSYAFERHRLDRVPNYRGVLKLERERIVNTLVTVALEHKAQIVVEDISGVDKSTWNSRLNLFRSHWDFGAFNAVLRYKAIIAGLPTIGRGQQLFSISGGVSHSVCSKCSASNAGRQNGEKLVRSENGWIHCRSCESAIPLYENALAVLLQRVQEYWRKNKN